MLPLNILLLLGGLTLIMVQNSDCILPDCDCEKTIQIPSMKPLLQKVLLPTLDLCKTLDLGKTLKDSNLLLNKGLGLCSEKDVLFSKLGATSCCGKCGKSIGVAGPSCGYTTHPAIIDAGPNQAYAPVPYTSAAYGVQAYGTASYGTAAYGPQAYGQTQFGGAPIRGPSTFTEFGDGFPVSPVGTVAQPVANPNNFGPRPGFSGLPSGAFSPSPGDFSTPGNFGPNGNFGPPGPPGNFGPAGNFGPSGPGNFGPTGNFGPPGGFGLRSLNSDTLSDSMDQTPTLSPPVGSNPQGRANTPSNQQQQFAGGPGAPPAQATNQRNRPQRPFNQQRQQQQQINPSQRRSFEDLNAAQSQVHYQYALPCEDLETSESNTAQQYVNINQELSDNQELSNNNNDDFHDEDMIFDSSGYDLETSESNITPEFIDMNQEISLPQKQETNDEEMVLNLHISIPPEVMQQQIKQYMESLNLAQNIGTEPSIQNTDPNIVADTQQVENTADQVSNVTPLYISEGDSTNHFNDYNSDLDTSETNIYPRNTNINDNHHYIAESKTAYYADPVEAKSSREETQPEEIHSDLAPTPKYGQSHFNNFNTGNTQNFNHMQAPYIPRRTIGMQNYLLHQDPFNLNFNNNEFRNKEVLHSEPKNNENINIQNHQNIPQREQPKINEREDIENYDELIEKPPLRPRLNAKDSEITSEHPRDTSSKHTQHISRQSKQQNIDAGRELKENENTDINLYPPRRDLSLNKTKNPENIKNIERKSRINNLRRNEPEENEEQFNRLNPRFQSMKDDTAPIPNTAPMTPKPTQNTPKPEPKLEPKSEPKSRPKLTDYPEYPEYGEYPEDYYDQAPPKDIKLSRKQMTRDDELPRQKSQKLENNLNIPNVSKNITTSNNNTKNSGRDNKNTRPTEELDLLNKQGFPQSAPLSKLPPNYPSQNVPRFPSSQSLNNPPSTPVPNNTSPQRSIPQESRYPSPQVPSYPPHNRPSYSQSPNFPTSQSINNLPSTPIPNNPSLQRSISQNPNFPSPRQSQSHHTPQTPHYPEYSREPNNYHQHQEPHQRRPQSPPQYEKSNLKRQVPSQYNNISPQIPYRNENPALEQKYPQIPQQVPEQYQKQQFNTPPSNVRQNHTPTNNYPFEPESMEIPPIADIDTEE